MTTEAMPAQVAIKHTNLVGKVVLLPVANKAGMYSPHRCEVQAVFYCESSLWLGVVDLESGTMFEAPFRYASAEQ